MGQQQGAAARLAVDIGGTFTDVVVEAGDRRTTAKVLTTPAAPEQAVLAAIGQVLDAAGLDAAEVALVIHGTTLATNAVIERTGATTALITTEGFRDVLAIADESRFDQYDINLVKTAPLDSARAAPDGARARDRGRRRAGAAGRGRGRRPGAGAAGARGRERRDRFSPLLCQPRARAALRRAPARRLAGALVHALLRGLPGDPRVRALHDRRRQRLRPAAHRGLPRAARAGPRHRRPCLPACS